ncbi:hypothetical protein STIUS_v1c04630 [Spiroplasma sp. TIUS-1]|uniref:hypothetical protein n=1 Tax=Spiroplasma sp. TIUS-1 TaxID=216963 RepID=UPI001398A220|nr:hypothetical protein [Spiroplasma sp. TIUS-1]QHX36017.1 hypothetical protein STIUS_v1c04630 [Spiroplasma sp. TIUS-1]
MNKEILRQTFFISNRQIATLGVCVALALVLSLFTLLFTAVAAPMAIELTFFTYLIAWKKTNVFYAIVVLTMSTWMRLLYIPDGFGIAGVLTLYIADLSQFTFFIIGWYVLGIIKSLNTEKSLVKFILAYLFAIIFTIIIMAIFTIYFLVPVLLPQLIVEGTNWQMYYFISGIIGNTVKYSVNLAIFIPIYLKISKL